MSEKKKEVQKEQSKLEFIFMYLTYVAHALSAQRTA